VISLPGNSLLLVPGAICYANFMLFELHEEHDLQPLLERSQTEPVVIFKHSTQCSRSAAAHDELQSFLTEHPEVPCGIVLVIEDRKLSNAMEDRFGIQHESPQAIVVSRGKPIWHADHFDVTAEALEDAIANKKIQG
jgi:bacillithiol system protein YtxJ